MTNIYYKDRASCLVYFADPEDKKDKKISNEQISDFCKLIIETKVDDAIIISNVPSSTAIQTLCTDITKTMKGAFIRYFKDDELMYDPTEHSLTPHHRIMSDKDVKYMKEVVGISLKKLPRISAFDPVAKRLGAKPGDLIEITRKVLVENNLIDEEIAFRTVFMPRIDKNKK
jgi:DNA-directed RNA polymerase subunit H